MLPSMLRERFLDVEWDRVAFEDLLEFWVRAFDAARTDDAALRVRAGVRLWCFPSAAGADLERALAGALAASGVGAAVRRADDVLTIQFDAPALGLVVSALAAPVAHGLAVEVSFAVEHGGAESEHCPPSATLVALGETRAAGICVKALCGHAGAGPHPETWAYGTEWDGYILEAFEEFRVTRGVSPHLMARARASEIRRRELAQFLARQERERAPRSDRPLVVKLLLYALLCAPPVLALLALQQFDALPPKQNRLLLQLAGGLSGITFAILVLRELADAPMRRRALRAAIDEAYRTVPRFESVAPDGALAHRLDDPNVRARTADALAAGFVLAGDVADVPHENATRVRRVFRAPDGVTYLILTFDVAHPAPGANFPRWPAACALVWCRTFFREADRVETMNAEHPFALLGRAPVGVSSASVPPDTPALELYKQHLERVKDWAADTGSRPVKHEPFERFVERQNEIAEQEWCAYWNRPAPAPAE